MNKKIKYFIIAGVIAVTVMIILVLHMDFNKDDNNLVVGFVMSGSINDEGWNGMHYDGIKAASEELDVELLVKENVAENEGQCIKAIKELANKDANVIILSSYNYSKEVKELVRKYQDIAFYCNSSEYHSKNMTSYFVRYYQARYLAGVLAGLQTKSDNIGYVAAMAKKKC